MAYATRPMHDADSHIMEPPAWLEGHLAAEHRARLAGAGRGRRTEHARRFDVDRIRRAHADPEYRAEDASQIMLRKNFARDRFVHRRRPAAGARAARLREPARVRHVHELARAAHRARRRSRARDRGRARASTAPCSTGARSTRGCCRCASSRSATWPPRSRSRARRSTAARPRCRSASTARPATRRATSISSRCGRCAPKRACRSCCTSRARARNVMDPDVLRERPAAGSRLPRRRRATSSRSTTCRSRCR